MIAKPNPFVFRYLERPAGGPRVGPTSTRAVSYPLWAGLGRIWHALKKGSLAGSLFPSRLCCHSPIGTLSIVDRGQNL